MGEHVNFLAFLQEFVDDKVWKDCPGLVNCICEAYMHLVEGQDENFGADFGSPEFWSVALGN